jgi:molybdate transport system substrate-binding protein
MTRSEKPDESGNYKNLEKGRALYKIRRRTIVGVKSMKKLFLIVVAGLLFVALNGCVPREQKTITAFSGAVGIPAMEEAARVFEERTGITVYLTFGGSGAMLSQMKLSRSGDLYIPASPDFMVMAERHGIVDPDSVKKIAYLVPAILVQHGNPEDIQALSDLARPGIEVTIADPKVAAIGLYAYEILERNDLLAEVGENIVTYAKSVAEAVSRVALRAVDATIGWLVTAEWHPETIDVVYLRPEQIPRIGYLSGAISTFTEDRESAQKFLDFLVSPEGQEIFRELGYITTESEARKFAPDAEIGGTYKLPEDYQPLRPGIR